MAKDKRPSDRVASDAGRVLGNPQSSQRDKELAASVLANREPKTSPNREQLARAASVLRAMNAKKGR